MSYCDPRIWPRKDQRVYEAYLQKLTHFSLWLLHQGYQLRIFTTSAGVDKNAVADLEERLRRPPAEGATAEKGQWPPGTVQTILCPSVSEMLQEMSGWDFVITSRYHGVIFSHLLAKPVIALSYQGKSDVAMEPLGLEAFTADIENFDASWLIETFRRLVAESESIRSREAQAVTARTKALRGQFDRLFAPAVNGRVPDLAEFLAPVC